MDKFQRLILINQYRILEKLYPDEAAGYAAHRKAFENGYELNYSWAVEGMDEVVTEAQCKEVINILQLFRTLLDHYNAGQVPESVKRNDIKFHGFDGNTEVEHYSYANYFINDLGRFQEQLENLLHPHSLNSHYPTLDRYRGMIKKWESQPDKYNLTPDQIDDIVNNWREN